MKPFIPTLVALGLVISHVPAAEPPGAPDRDQPSYRFGFNIGHTLKRQAAKMKTEDIVAGMSAALADGTSGARKEDLDKFLELFGSILNQVAANNTNSAAQNLTSGVEFMAANAKQAGVVTLPSGLQYKIVAPGDGKSPARTDEVTVHYRGTLLNGIEFDSSYKRNMPATFRVDGVIKGWTEALQLMKPGSKWILWIPPSLAYGEEGSGDRIGPNATLVFEVELLSFRK